MKSYITVILTAMLATTSVSAYPTTESGTTTSTTVLMTAQVDCGCWNDCRLNGLFGGDIIACPAVCDPRFMCQLDSSPGSVTKRAANADADAELDKRGGSVSATCTTSGGKVGCTATLTFTF